MRDIFLTACGLWGLLLCKAMQLDAILYVVFGIVVLFGAVGLAHNILEERGEKHWTIVKKVDRGMRKISKAQPRHARRTKVQPD